MAFTSSFSQKKVEFYSADSILITADLYETEETSYNYLILLHQADYSRGEYKEIAARLIKLGYNCLAVDLRLGNEVNYVQNETSARLKEKNQTFTQLDVKKDINASIEYVKSLGDSTRISLFGSSFTASLALIVANENSSIVSAIAFSPGEFFEPTLSVRNSISSISKPCYIASPKSEYPYIETLIEDINKKHLTVFIPERGDGLHGAKTLWWESSTRNEYWLSLLFFLNDLKNE